MVGDHSADTRGAGAVENGEAPDRLPDRYEPPQLTVLGSISELTQTKSSNTTDGTFPGSLFA